MNTVHFWVEYEFLSLYHEETFFKIIDIPADSVRYEGAKAGIIFD